MNNTLNVVFIIIFLGMVIVSSIVMLDTNFEKIFKKGRTSEIRASYVLVSFILGSVFSFFVVKLVETVTSLILK